MSRTRHAVSARDSHILTLRILIGVMTLVCVGMWYGWKSSPDQLTIHNPPDLRSGSTRLWWQIDPSSVYAYTFYVWQQLNRWHVDGREDYRRQLNGLSPFFTQSCMAHLKEDYEARNRRQELQGRVRGMYEIPGRGYRTQENGSVRIVSNDSWVVNLDVVLNETFRGEPVRDIYVRYPIRVLRADVDPQRNPWGLLIDCFEGTPERMGIPGQEDAGW